LQLAVKTKAKEKHFGVLIFAFFYVFNLCFSISLLLGTFQLPLHLSLPLFLIFS